MTDHHSGPAPDTARVRFIQHQGKPILYCDFAHCDDDREAMRRIAEARRECAAQRKKSVVALVDVTDSRLNTRLIRACRELAIHNEPYVIASALIGIDQVSGMVLKGISIASGREFRLFDNELEAKHWLITQLPD